MGDQEECVGVNRERVCTWGVCMCVCVCVTEKRIPGRDKECEQNYRGRLDYTNDFAGRKNSVRKPGLEREKVLSSFWGMMSLKSLYTNRDF